MKEKENKELDKLAARIIKDASIEKPSFDFANNVIAQIETLTQEKMLIRYEPLISKKVWVYIGIVFLILLFLSVFKFNENSVTWLSQIDYSFLLKNKITQSISGFRMPRYLSYSIILFCLMICIQIPFLKNYFNQRLKV